MLTPPNILLPTEQVIRFGSTLVSRFPPVAALWP